MTRRLADKLSGFAGLAWDENLDVGSNTGTPVDDGDYQVPSAFTGTIGKITLKIDRPKLTPDDIAKLKDAMAKAGDGPAPGESAGASGTGGAGKVALRVDKLDDCRKQAEAKGLGLVDRIKFIEDCAR